ncbi:MAG: magnesium transporter [Bacteroidetes bacterium]|nr:magnesium transporter [Bacteroidota bacterium]
MQFELTDEFLLKLREAISAHNGAFVHEHFKELYPPDIAEIFNKLEIEEAKYVYTQLDEQIAADVLVELDDSVREDFLASLTSKEIAEHIDNMDSDDAADVIAELPDSVQDEVLSHMEDSEQASDIVDLLNFDENTAGGLMATELVRVHLNSSAIDCVREIRAQADVVENIYSIYVVDEDAEEVANIMDKYNLVVLPVIDALGRLVGRITVDDVVDVRREEETEDVQKMGAMEALEEPYMSTPFLQMIRKRAGWLIILFLGETLTATAMAFFQDQIAKAVILALFIPLIISSGGNSGSQASTLIIRALALGEITIRDWWKIVKKEFSTGLVIGLILGIIGFARVGLWSYFISSYGPHWMLIACTVSFSLVGVVLWGTLMGSLLPLFLKRIGLDPAVSSAP